MNNQYFYLIPLPIIHDLISDSKAIYRIYHLGIYYSSKKIEYDIDNAYKDFVYCVYRHNDELSIPLQYEYENFMIDFPFDADYEGFRGCDGEFEPYEEMQYVKEYSCGHAPFLEQLIEWHQIRSFYNIVGLDKKSVKNLLVSVDECLQKHDFKSVPFILLNSKVMHNLSQEAARMTASDRAMWAMYLGILSIIGDKDFAQTTSSMIKCRMFGAKTLDDLKLKLKNSRMKKLYDKFTTKHQYQKLLDKLQDRNMIKELGYNRRTYISTKANDVNDLANMILEKEIAAKKKLQRNEEKKNARNRLRAALEDVTSSHTAQKGSKNTSSR